MKSVEIKAPAKINIGLNIVSKRPDGYHNLETFFYPINDLYDKIIIKRSDAFSFSTNSDILSLDDGNLVVKAVKLLERTFKTSINVQIHLEKVIPVGAGLGGGSSDAAAVLISLNDMLNFNLSFEKLVELSLQLGSDVPFFVKAKPAIAKSRGEQLTFTDISIVKPILIVNPGIHVSTAEAFGSITPKENPFNYSTIPELLRTDLPSLVDHVKNDFEESVFSRYPEIKIIKDMLYDAGSTFALMSGSGSTVFGIFNSEYEAEKARHIFPEKYFTFISRREE